MPPADKQPNVFELRTYMSPGEAKGLNKIQMFESGEITVMKEHSFLGYKVLQRIPFLQEAAEIVYAHQGAVDPAELRRIIFDDPYMGRIYK